LTKLQRVKRWELFFETQCSVGLAAGGDGSNRWDWEGTGNKTWLCLGAEMRVNSLKREGSHRKRHFRSSLLGNDAVDTNCCRIEANCVRPALQELSRSVRALVRCRLVRLLRPHCPCLRVPAVELPCTCW